MPASKDVVEFPGQFGPGGSGNGPGDGDLLERVVRLEGAVNQLRETVATKADILESEMRTQKLITDAIKDVDQKHALFYRWVIGTLLSVMAIGAYLFSRK